MLPLEWYSTFASGPRAMISPSAPVPNVLTNVAAAVLVFSVYSVSGTAAPSPVVEGKYVTF